MSKGMYGSPKPIYQKRNNHTKKTFYRYSNYAAYFSIDSNIQLKIETIIQSIWEEIKKKKKITSLAELIPECGDCFSGIKVNIDGREYFFSIKNLFSSHII